MAKISLDNKLAVDRFLSEERNPHIVLSKDFDNPKDIELVVMACPAGLYRYEDGKVSFNHEGCLECGTCRVLSKGKLVKTWGHPMGGKGVEFRQG